MPAEGTENKKARVENENSQDLQAVVQSVELPPEVAAPQGTNDVLNLLANAQKELKKQEISRIKKLLAIAYAKAPLATENPFIHTVCVDDWSEVEYDPHGTSLAEVLFSQGGWTEANMFKFIGQSPTPFLIPPLSMPESRALWASIRYQVGMNSLREVATFGISLPETWLAKKLKFDFGKKGGLDFARKLAAMVEYNQAEFIGKRKYWFRPLCEKLGGFHLSENFQKISLVSIFVVCCDPPDLLESSVKDVKGTWGSGARSQCKIAWTEAVKKAIRENTVKYPSTLRLFKNLFPDVLK